MCFSPKALLISAAIAAGESAISAAAFFLRLFLPASVLKPLLSAFNGLFSHLSNQLTIVVEESDGSSPNRMYRAAETYLASAVVPSASTATRLRVTVPYDDDDTTGGDPYSAEVRSEAVQIKLDRGEVVVDFYKGIKFLWNVSTGESFRNKGRYRFFYDNVGPTEVKYYEITFHKRYRDFAIKSYLPHILERAKAIGGEAKTVKFHTNDKNEMWTTVKLHHRITFDAVAMDVEEKMALVDDLSRFIHRKEYYRSIGRPWKRGYLLYGPPGMGKTTLIAAMANLLRFDIYNLELTEVRSNAALRSLLINSTRRSIMVIEDIDCLAELQQIEKDEKPEPEVEGSSKDESKVTLSSLLNFVDGLCGDERIIIFTTNYKDKLDPVLLQPGRVDMHIHMEYCDPSSFMVLASKYHSLDHPLFAEIDRLIRMVRITPAEITEPLSRSDNAEIALKEVVKLLSNKVTEVEEMVVEGLLELQCSDFSCARLPTEDN